MLITQAISDNWWKPVPVCRGGPKLSHLLFADDILLFSKATPVQTSVVKDAVRSFCMDSGQKVSVDKSITFVSPMVPSDICGTIHTITDIRLATKLGKYLGVPIMQGCSTKQQFDYVLEKLQLRLSNWKARNLSLARWCTLIQSVLAGVPNYVMQTSWLL